MDVGKGGSGEVGELGGPGSATPASSLPPFPAFSLPNFRAALSWVAQPAVREVALAFVAWRLALSGVVLVASGTIANRPTFAFFSLFDAWSYWDGGWYKEIAQLGYSYSGPAEVSSVAFFPFYPLLIRVFMQVTGATSHQSAFWVANLAFVPALIYLYRLAEHELGSRRLASRVVFYTMAFPTAFFFGAGMTESLFLLFTVGSLYHARREEWVLAGAHGFLATLTRANGLLLLLPLALCYLGTHGSGRRKIGWDILSLGLLPLALLVFMAYLASELGDPWAFARVRGAWGQALQPPWEMPIGYAREILMIWRGVLPWQSMYHLLSLLFLGLSSLLTLVAFFRLPPVYGVYMLATVLLLLFGGSLQSMSRYALHLFPGFFVLAQLGENEQWDRLIIFLFLPLQGVLATLFVTGKYFIG